VPFRYADVFVMLDAVDVVTAGGAGVLKLSTAPTPVPTELDAIAQ